MILNSLLAKTKNGAYPTKPFNSSYIFSMAGVYAILSGNVYAEIVVKDIVVSSTTKPFLNFTKLLNLRRDFTCKLICKFN
jgi:uncharacterized membrane protein